MSKFMEFVKEADQDFHRYLTEAVPAVASAVGGSIGGNLLRNMAMQMGANTQQPGSDNKEFMAKDEYCCTCPQCGTKIKKGTK